MKALLVLSLLLLLLASSSCGASTKARAKPRQIPSRTFTSYRTNSISQKSCVCSTPSSCSCCEIVTIFYTGDKKKLCFNMAYQNNGLSFDLALDSLIIESMLVTNYKPMEMCSAVPGVLFSTVCVNILQLERSPSSIRVCPRVQVSSKKERWQITYSCSQLSRSATTTDAATTIAPAATVQLMLASTMSIQPSPATSAPTKPMVAASEQTTTTSTTTTTTTAKPTSMPAAGAALMLQMPAGVPGVMAIVPGLSTMAISMGQTSSGKPMLQVSNGKPAMGQMTISMGGLGDASNATTVKPDASLKTTTLKPGGPVMTLIGQIVTRPATPVASTFQRFEPRDNSSKRAKRNTDWFDLLHQSNRCERAYRICVTRSKHYVISKLKRPKLEVESAQSVVDCSSKNPVKIVNEAAGGNDLCNYPSPATIATTPGIQIAPTPARPLLPEPNTIVTNFSEALDAIIIQDSELASESGDFYPQHGPYVVPIPPQRPAKYPNRIPPLVALQVGQQQVYKDANATFALADLY